MAGGRILVVDDDNVLRASISRILEEEGYTVDSAPDGATALDMVKSDPPDAILLDVMMPGMNGRQFLKELRRGAEPSSDIPVVVMTALQGLADRALEYGANDLVEKPFAVDELLNKVALALFRSGEYDTLTDRPPRPRPAGSEPPPLRRPVRAGTPLARVVLVVDEDQAALARLDARLGKQGYTMVALSRGGEELPRLARALEPRAIVIGLDAGTHGMNSLRQLRGNADFDHVPILLVAGEQPRLEQHRAEIFGLAAEVAFARSLADADVAGFVGAPPEYARRPRNPT